MKVKVSEKSVAAEAKGQLGPLSETNSVLIAVGWRSLASPPQGSGVLARYHTAATL